MQVRGSCKLATFDEKRCQLKAKFHYTSWFGASSELELAPN